MGNLTDQGKAPIPAPTQHIEKAIKLLAPLAEDLKDGKRGFCDSIADGLRTGSLPFGRGLDITLDILSKKVAKKEREAEYKRLYKVFTKAESILEKARTLK